MVSIYIIAFQLGVFVILSVVWSCVLLTRVCLWWTNNSLMRSQTDSQLIFGSLLRFSIKLTCVWIYSSFTYFTIVLTALQASYINFIVSLVGWFGCCRKMRSLLEIIYLKSSVFLMDQSGLLHSSGLIMVVVLVDNWSISSILFKYSLLDVSGSLDFISLIVCPNVECNLVSILLLSLIFI